MSNKFENLDKETEKKLEEVDQLAKQLEDKLVDILLPDDLEAPPSPDSVLIRAEGFLQAVLKNVLHSCYHKVEHKWPSHIKDEPVEQKQDTDALQQWMDNINNTQNTESVDISTFTNKGPKDKN